MMSFDLSELRTICFDLAIDFDNLVGDAKESKIVSLLLYCERAGNLPNLITHCYYLRPEYFTQLSESTRSSLSAELLLRAQEAALDQARMLNFPLDEAKAVAKVVIDSLALS